MEKMVGTTGFGDKDELAQMHEQISLLKKKLDEQVIVNEQLMRKTVSGKIHRLKRGLWLMRGLVVFAMMYVLGIFYRVLGAPLWFIVVVGLFFLLALVYQEISMNGINSDDMSEKGLLEVRRKALKMKKMNANWLWVGIPAGLLLISASIYIVWNHADIDADAKRAMIVGMVVGIMVGTPIGVKIYLKRQREAKELIDEIEEMTAE